MKSCEKVIIGEMKTVLVGEELRGGHHRRDEDCFSG